MPWAIYSDLSGVEELSDTGIHPSEEVALQKLILHAESNRSDLTAKIIKARARLRRLNRRKT